MVPSSDYRRYAQQCLDAAELAPPDESKELLEMAQAWLALAREAIAADIINSPSKIS